jgi:hypothetical protein
MYQDKFKNIVDVEILGQIVREILDRESGVQQIYSIQPGQPERWSKNAKTFVEGTKNGKVDKLLQVVPYTSIYVHTNIV